MGFNQILEISRRSFRAHQAALSNVSQNAANAESDDYHRRRISMTSEATAGGGVNIPPPGDTDRMGGVSVGAFERVRDTMYTSLGREAQTGLSTGEEESRILQGLEGILASDSDASMENVLNEFWNGWSDLADNPTDSGVREALISKTDTLTDTFSRIGRDINQLEGETASALEQGVRRANEITHRIADLNEDIQAAEASGSPNYSAEDERDALVRELSELAPLQVNEDENDGYHVKINGMSLVEGTEVTELNLGEDNGDPFIEFGSSGVTYEPNGQSDGELGVWLRTLNETLPEVRGELDGLVEDIVTTVNDLHADGYDLNDDTGEDFFDEDGTSLDTIQLDESITGGDTIAAASEPGEPGNADVANAIVDERRAFDDRAIDISASIGTRVDEAQKQASAQSATLAQIDALEDGVSEVSLDDELTDMIEHQQTFAASSRVLQTAQQMMDSLLAI